MNIRKLTLLCASLFTWLAAAAQFSYGPQLGVNFSDLTFKQKIVDTSMQVGPSAALQCEFIFTDFGLGIDFGIGYSMTGAKVNLGQKTIWSLPAQGGFGNETTLAHNLWIPVHIRWKWTKMQGVEEYVAPIVYGGPEFNIQVANSNNSHNGIDAYRFSGGDVQLACGAGVELFRHWQITAGYSWGMTYMVKTRLLDDYSARSHGWTLRLAYMF
ncbi:MAG: PorT family protein [Bacteroidales bacterium]|nr:PorT family protein [Bacteroidales bacterium]